jgi:hypothetical protein
MARIQGSDTTLTLGEPRADNTATPTSTPPTSPRAERQAPPGMPSSRRAVPHDPLVAPIRVVVGSLLTVFGAGLPVALVSEAALPWAGRALLMAGGLTTAATVAAGTIMIDRALPTASRAFYDAIDQMRDYYNIPQGTANADATARQAAADAAQARELTNGSPAYDIENPAPPGAATETTPLMQGYR